MIPLDDLDPPTFQFGRRRRERRTAREAAAEGGAAGAEETPPEEEAAGQPEPDDGLEVPHFEQPPDRAPEITVTKAEDEAPKPPLWRRLPFGRSETAARVMVVIPWIVLAIFFIALGGEAFMLLLIALGVLGIREFCRMAADARPLAIPAYLVMTGMVIAAHYGSSFQVLLLFATAFPALFVFAARRRSLDGVTLAVAVSLLAIAWFGLGLSHAMLLRDLPDHGGALLIDVLVATFVGDTAAYGAGRLFGSRKITPRISPNKTLEGAIGGFAGATMGFWFAGLYQDWLPGIDALLMGMAIAVVAPVGDLFASMIKRDLEIKDTGTLFGPHGGLIDRLDAVLFTVVAGYYLSLAFVY